MKRISESDLRHILDKTKDIWEPVRNKSIFLTGGTGFFGKWLLESFIDVNEQLQLAATITVLTRNPEKFLTDFPFYKDNTSVKFIKGDILNFEFPSEDFNYIIHAATEADAALNSSQPLLMLDTITVGTRRMLDFARQKSVESFLFISSGAIYGKQPETVTHVKETESFPVDINNPNSAYAEGKRLAELYCSIYYSHYKLPIKVARCFAFVGPYLPLDKHFAIGNFIRNVLNKEDIVIKGDGTAFRSYLYASDLAISLWIILLKGTTNSPYNVGSEDNYTIEEIASLVAKQSPVKINCLIKGQKGMAPVERYVPSMAKAKEELNLSAFMDINEAIQRTFSFYKN